jgi:hypothetical protein
MLSVSHPFDGTAVAGAGAEAAVAVGAARSAAAAQRTGKFLRIEYISSSSIRLDYLNRATITNSFSHHPARFVDAH